jgi:hypothetical protein
LSFLECGACPPQAGLDTALQWHRVSLLRVPHPERWLRRVGVLPLSLLVPIDFIGPLRRRFAVAQACLPQAGFSLCAFASVGPDYGRAALGAARRSLFALAFGLSGYPMLVL